MKIIAPCLIGVLGLMVAAPALADCAADATVRDVREAFARGQQQEKAGDTRAALGAYVAAQEYTCDPNPVAAQAASRAAGLARPLGDAARSRGDHAAAFDFYERGGHFAAADHALLARIEAAPDDVQLYGEALRHTQYRALPAFQQNEAVRLAVTGAYAPDAGLMRAVEAMPARAMDRALAAEAAAFDESWYGEYVALVEARPANPADIAALQQYGGRMQAFHAAHPKDPLQEPLDVLAALRSWQVAVVDDRMADTILRRRAERAESRAALLAAKYAAAPRLLELAMDYLGHATSDSASLEPRLQKVRRQAEGLGDKALAAGRPQLAIEYFDVARAEAKQQQARAAMEAMTMRQLQPSIAAMQRNAEALQAQFADPQKIAEMQRQAQQAQQAQRELQAGKQERQSRKAGDADALAAELGM